MDTEYKRLIKVVSYQNDNLEKRIKEIEDKRTTDNQIVNYKNVQTEWFNNTNKMLLFLYYFLAIIFMYQVITKKTTTSSFKYITIFLLILFPFIIGKIELLAYNTIKYIWTFIMCVEYPYHQSG